MRLSSWFLGIGFLACAWLAACAGGGDSDGTPAGGSAGKAGSAGTSGKGGSAGASGSSGSGGAAASGGSAGSGGASGSAGDDGGAGAGGTGGTTDAAADALPEAGWPTCDAQPTGVPAKTILQIWADNPSAPTPVWVDNVYATAVSGGGCVAGSACQIFLQQNESYASLSLGAKQAIKLRISGQASQYFTGIAVGDQVDVLGHAWRYNLGGANELVIQVNLQLQGCAKQVGTGNPMPITGVTLADLTLTAYEQTHGPLLIQVATVSGKPQGAGEIFGIWETGVGIGDASATDLVSISPYFLQGNAFTGFTAGQIVNFQTVTGVFGQYIPSTESGTPPKYHVIYPRSMADLVQ
jgi:hypothetical protein